jgi:hypothetical protein
MRVKNALRPLRLRKLTLLTATAASASVANAAAHHQVAGPLQAKTSTGLARTCHSPDSRNDELFTYGNFLVAAAALRFLPRVTLPWRHREPRMALLVA